jgi:hypothetical protein
MKKIFTEAVLCHLVKYGSFLAIAVLVYTIIVDDLVDRLPEKFGQLELTENGRKWVARSEEASSLLPESVNFPEFENKVNEVVSFVQDDSLKDIALIFYNSSASYPQGQALTLHQACSALVSLQSKSKKLSKCDLQKISETKQALSTLFDLYIIDRFQWGSDPLRLERSRLSRLGYDLTDVFQRDLIKQGKFTKFNQNKYDLRSDGRSNQLEKFASY